MSLEHLDSDMWQGMHHVPSHFHYRAVSRVIDHFSDSLAQPFTLPSLSKVGAYSPFHFNRIFRQVTGVSPIRYLYMSRLVEARRLLLTTDRKVIDVCYDVGYASLGSFNKRFKSLVGIPPRRVRQLAHRLHITDLQVFCAARWSAEAAAEGPRSVRGFVRLPNEFSGLCLVMLCRTPIAQLNYTTSSVALRSGEFALPGAPDGRYYVLALAQRWDQGVRRFLIQDEVWRADAGPVQVVNGKCDTPVNLVLRAPRLTDPPPVMLMLAARASSMPLFRASNTNLDVDGQQLPAMGRM